jgi:hypothetical protein
VSRFARLRQVKYLTDVFDKTFSIPVGEIGFFSADAQRFPSRRTVHMADNNLIEQDHRSIKLRLGPMLGFKSMSTTRRIIAGYEIFAMIREGKVVRTPANDMGAQRILIASLFAIAA